MQQASRTMKAIVTTGTGGYEKLELRHVPMPEPGLGEVLLEVLAAGVNNTDINTRLGWYSSSVRDGTAQTDTSVDRPDGGWNAALRFPLIQGADCCGRVVAVGPDGDTARIGQRVIVRSCMREHGFESMKTVWLGSDFDGAFAQYVKVPAAEAFAVNCSWSDAELATIPCAYGTAENMVMRAGVAKGTRVLVPGASGGVGSAVVQLARRRGAVVIAITGADKGDKLKQIGADRVLTRSDDLVAELGKESVDVVIDNVGGTSFGLMLKVLRLGGRYASSGAIAGPIVELDLRDMYLKDITLIGCTAWDEQVFQILCHISRRQRSGRSLQRTYPLEGIADAQAAFGRKDHVGKIVLLPGG
jgi:NADPH:quinone reductase-like Zn-dependent oxidoreductase